jgi:hypothetical protein
MLSISHTRILDMLDMDIKAAGTPRNLPTATPFSETRDQPDQPELKICYWMGQVKLRKWRCAAPFSSMSSTHAHNSSRKLRLPVPLVCPRLDSQANFFSIVILSWVHLSPLITAATTSLLYQPKLTVEEWRLTVGNQSTHRKPAPVPLCPPQMTITGLEPGLPRWKASD